MTTKATLKDSAQNDIATVNPAIFATAEDVKTWITVKEIGFGKVMMPLRLALVGELSGPDVFDIIYMIGKPETIKRLENLIEA